MFEILIGILIGFVVCFFGMWCYIKGEQNGLKLANKEQPQQIITPVQAVSEGMETLSDMVETKKNEKKSVSIEEQFKNMQNY